MSTPTRVDPLLSALGLSAPAESADSPLAPGGSAGVVAVRAGRAELASPGGPVTACVAAWDFAVQGGSFGAREADVFVSAVDDAIAQRLPLLTLIRSGGTRLPEGMRALVGMPRVVLALRRLAACGLAHVCLLDRPTTGGVFVTVGSRADLRAAVAGATVGFAGPRVVAAATGAEVAGSHTAETAYAAGLVDALVERAEALAWAGRALDAVRDRPLAPPAAGHPAAVEVPTRDAAAQVAFAREAPRPGGSEILSLLLPGAVDLEAGRGSAVRAAVGHLAGGRAVVAVALADARQARPHPTGFRLLTRAAVLAGRWGLPLLTLVDTPGAEPGSEAENDGLAAAIGEAMEAVLACPTPTLAVVHGEGGSGGALAAAAADRVLIGPSAYFAALLPEGAAAALRCSPAEAAQAMSPTPADLLRLGVADAMVPAADAAGFAEAVGQALDGLAAEDPSLRWRTRMQRWSSGVRVAPTG